MQIFLDTGSVKEVEEAFDSGVVDGVTTNPTLIAKQGVDFHKTIKQIARIVAPGPVSAEVISTDTEGMLKEAYKLSRLARNVVVKIPLIPDGIKAVGILSKKGVRYDGPTSTRRSNGSRRRDSSRPASANRGPSVAENRAGSWRWSRTGWPR